MQSDPIIPYEVFKVEHSDPKVKQPEFGAYQLPDGQVAVLANYYSCDKHIFKLRADADKFFDSWRNDSNRRIIQLNPEDYPKFFTSAISFEETQVKGTTPQIRVEKEKPAEIQKAEDSYNEQDEIRQNYRVETKDSNNNLPENLNKNKVDDMPRQDNASRVKQNEPEQTQSQDESGLDWGTVFSSTAESLAIGAGVTAAGAALVAAGIVSAPVLVGAGLGLGIISLFENASEAKDAGAEVSFSKALTKTVSGMIPGDPVGLFEVGFNYNYMTEREMTQQERSEKAGNWGSNIMLGAVTSRVAKGAKANKGNKKNQKSQDKNENVGKSRKEIRDNLKEIRGEHYQHKIDPHIITDVVENLERHHSIPQALFRRLEDEVLRGFIHEVGSLPIDKKLHHKIHRELDVILRNEGFMKKSKPYLTKEEFKMALQLIEEFYAKKSIKHPGKEEFGKLRDAVRTFHKTLESANLL